MSNETYKIRLRKEFELLQKLQRHPSVNNDTIKITIQYKDRLRGGDYKSVLENPSSGLYPNSFRVTYKMPVYVGPGQLKRDWQASFLFSTPENILMNPQSSLKLEIEGGRFVANAIPYHPEVSKSGEWLNTGALWSIANFGFGIWYFLVTLGCELNEEKLFMRQNDNHAVSCLNYDAFKFWKYERNMQPISNIDWPFKLSDEHVIEKLPYDYDDEKQSFWFGEPYTEKKQQTFTFEEKN